MAPRVSPKSEIPHIDIYEENVDTVAPRNKSTFSESPSHDDMRRVEHSKHTIHPCVASKESEFTSSLGASEGKTRVQKKNVVVRSRYFQPKILDKTDAATKKIDQSVGDDDKVIASENTTSEVKTSVENRKLHKSRYFAHSNQEHTNERLIETSNCEGLPMKRKFSIVDDSVQKENVNQKYTRSSQSHANQGECTSDLEDQMQVTRDEEEKFGCNISHLRKYSEIAEKSMEKFISVISSFKCISSGSRASGL